MNCLEEARAQLLALPGVIRVLCFVRDSYPQREVKLTLGCTHVALTPEEVCEVAQRLTLIQKELEQELACPVCIRPDFASPWREIPRI